MWALQPSSSTGADYQHVANAVQWSPNESLPGSDGSNARSYDAGQGVNVIAAGGSDGSCVPGRGTFIIRNSNNCGIADSPAILTLNTTSVSGYDHLYTFAGALYQEGTQNDMLMTDSYGNTAIILFVLTYRVRTAATPTTTTGHVAVRRRSGFERRSPSCPPQSHPAP